MTLDFSEPSTKDIPVNSVSDGFSNLIDAALVAKREAEPKRHYLGGSRLGHPNSANPWDRGCDRQLWYEWKHYQSDKPFDADLYRIFDMGHDAEKRVGEYLKLAGFDLRTEKPDGGQFGFYVAPDPVTGKSRISGHADGIILSYQGLEEGAIFTGAGEERKHHKILFPMLWENKGMNNKKWTSLVAKGVERSHPVYYGQMQIYMGFLELKSALFTALNRDTGKIHYEIVPYNEKDAQATLDRGARVVSAKSALELSRITTDYSSMACKWCSYRSHCQKDELGRSAAEPSNQTPEWIK